MLKQPSHLVSDLIVPLFGCNLRPRRRRAMRSVELLEDRTLLSGLEAQLDVLALPAELATPSFQSFIGPRPAQQATLSDTSTETPSEQVTTTFTAINADEAAALNGGNYDAPADPDGAVGMSHLVNVVFGAIEWYLKDGTRQNRQSMTSFFASLSPTARPFYAKVTYDHYTDRFVVMALEKTDSPQSSRILIAASDDGDPNGTWNYHAVDAKLNIAGVNTWADAPGFAFDEEALYISTNQHGFGGAFRGSRLYIVDKSQLYAGSTPNVSVHDFSTLAGLGNQSFATIPALMYGPGPGNVGTFMVSQSWAFGDGDEAAAIFTVRNPLTTPTFSVEFQRLGDKQPNFVTFQRARQPMTSNRLDTGDARTKNVAWRNDVLQIANTYFVTDAGPNFAQETVHWFRFDTSGVSPAASPQRAFAEGAENAPLIGQGLIGGEDETGFLNVYTWNPSLAIQPDGTWAITYNVSSQEVFPGGAYNVVAPDGTLIDSGPDPADTGSITLTGDDNFGRSTSICFDPALTGQFFGYNQVGVLAGNWGSRWFGVTNADIPDDWGDAPQGYPTARAQDGARHGPYGPRLGDHRDAEVDGTPSPNADADDNTGTADDEDGVNFPPFKVGFTSQVTVNVQNAPLGAKLFAWIDWNGNQAWQDGDEFIAAKRVVNGNNIIDVSPPTLTPMVFGPKFARFRLSTTGTPTVTGRAIDGEVEDYAVMLAPGDLSLTFDEASIREGETAIATVTRQGNNFNDPVVVGLGTTNPNDVQVWFFDPDDGLPINSVVIPPGQASATFEVQAINDGKVDGDKTVTVTADAVNHNTETEDITVEDEDRRGSQRLSGPQSGSLPAGDYHVDGDILIAAGDTWILEPGVRMYVFPGANVAITVDGSLIAEGTSDDPIVIRSAAENAPSGRDWTGILAGPDGQVSLSGVEIAHAASAIRFAFDGLDALTATPLIQVSDSSIHHCSDAGIDIDVTGGISIAKDSIVITGTTFSECGIGARFSTTSSNTPGSLGGTLSGNTFVDNGIAISIDALTGPFGSDLNVASIDVTGNTINNNVDGILTSAATGPGTNNKIEHVVVNNVILNNTGDALNEQGDHGGTQVIHNTIGGNIGAGIFLGAGGQPANLPQIHNNSVTDNGVGVEADGDIEGMPGVITNNDNWGNTRGNWVRVFGEDIDNVSVDPLLQPDGFHLSENSPLIGAGNPGAFISDDFEGDPRDSAPDIGADELRSVNGPPQVGSLIPPDGATDVPVATDLRLVFNEAVFPGVSNLTLTLEDNTTHVFDVNDANIVFAGSTITFDIPFNLPEGEVVTVDVDPDAVQGAAPESTGSSPFDAMTETFTPPAWSFTTGIAPAINNVGNATSYLEGRPPLLLAANASLGDADTPILNRGQLQATITSGREAGDRLQAIDFRDVTVTGSILGSLIDVAGVHVGTIRDLSQGGITIDLNANATLENVESILNAIAFSNSHDDLVPGTREITFTVSDGTGSSSVPRAKIVTVNSAPDRPQIASVGGPVTFIEDAGPIDLTSTGTLFDPDLHPDWNGARLNVRVSRNLDSFDRLTIRNDGMGAGQIGVVGTGVFYEGTQIGTFNGGVGTTRLQINFIAGSTTASIQALIRAIQFENLIDLPVVASKDVRFELTDPQNFANLAIPNGIMTVNMQGTNDLPTIAGISATPVTYNEGGAPRTVGTGGTISDADYNGTGFLRVSIVAGGEANDRLGVLHQGLGTNQVGVSGNQIFFSGVLIATRSGGIGTNPMQMNFNSNATRTGAQAVMRLVQYSSVSEDPSTVQRQLDFLFNDGDGADSNVLSAFVNVNATNDPSVIANFGADVNTTTGTNVRVSNLVNITDVDSPDFAGGLFRATISSGQQAGDTLSLFNDATVTTVGANVFYLGTLIGTLSTNATSLTVVLNASATATMVQRLGRNLEFSAALAGTRAIRYQVLDGDGGNTSTPDKNVNVS